MVRVIGRVDLADEVHRALAAAGIESNVVTAGPVAAAATAGEDGAEAVVVRDLGTCAGIKRKARNRPVLMITTAKDERRVLAHMRGALGPDAHVVWPASGEDLRGGIARAVAAAGTVRPRILGGRLAGNILVTLGIVLLGVHMVRVIARADRMNDTFQVAGGGLFGVGLLLTAPYSLMRRGDLIFGALMILLAAVQLALWFVV